MFHLFFFYLGRFLNLIRQSFFRRFFSGPSLILLIQSLIVSPIIILLRSFSSFWLPLHSFFIHFWFYLCFFFFFFFSMIFLLFVMLYGELCNLLNSGWFFKMSFLLLVFSQILCSLPLRSIDIIQLTWTNDNWLRSFVNVNWIGQLKMSTGQVKWRV